MRKDPAALRRVLAVAWREFRHTVLTKGFIFGALVMPVVMFVASVRWSARRWRRSPARSR
jgi:hypothetical protein